MNRKAIFLVVICCAVFLLGHEAWAAEKAREKSTTLNVPTSGKIMDVTYMPEFDEWWVKCREGENIAVYSYDRRAKTWGRVLFTRKQSEGKAQTPVTGEKPGKTEPTPDSQVDEPGKGTITEGRPEEPLKQGTETKKEEEKRPTKGEKMQWWNPLNILKMGEKLIRPE